LRTRGGQIAGFGAAVLALIGGNAAAILSASHGSGRVVVGVALLAAVACLTVAVAVATWGVILPRPFVAIAAEEIANYASERFLAEPDLWRVQVRSLRALEEATREAQEDGNDAMEGIMVSSLWVPCGFRVFTNCTWYARLRVDLDGKDFDFIDTAARGATGSNCRSARLGGPRLAGGTDESLCHLVHGCHEAAPLAESPPVQLKILS
jgi:hypothetical protein